MGYSEMISHAAEQLAPTRQLEVLDFIGFLKTRQERDRQEVVPRTPEEIEVFFRSFNVDVSKYRFDREEANAR
ncbi:MAG: hypothetical protein ACP5I8_05105 [Phycisphaerae bacterium]